MPVLHQLRARQRGERRRGRPAPARARTASGTRETAAASRSRGSGRVSWPRGRRSTWSRTGGSASTRASSSGVGARVSRQPPPREPRPEARPSPRPAAPRARSRRGPPSRTPVPRCQADGVTSQPGERLDRVADGAPRPPRPARSAARGTRALRAISSSWVPVVGHPAALEDHDPVGEVRASRPGGRRSAWSGRPARCAARRGSPPRCARRRRWWRRRGPGSAGRAGSLGPARSAAAGRRRGVSPRSPTVVS